MIKYHFVVSLAFGEWVQKAHLRKEDLEDLMMKENPTKRAAENEKTRESKKTKQLPKRMSLPPG